MRKRKKTELKKRKIIKNKIRLANKKLTASNLEKKIRQDSSSTSLSRFIIDYIFTKSKNLMPSEGPSVIFENSVFTEDSSGPRTSGPEDFRVDFRSFKFGSLSALSPSWSSFTGLRFFSRSKSGSSVSRKG